MKLFSTLTLHLLKQPRAELEKGPTIMFTGNPPNNPSEKLVSQIANGRASVSFQWLLQEISSSLYEEELRRGGWVVDIGVCGPSGFRKDASLILASMRPEFGTVMEESEANQR